jgi:hypothetical protein
MIKAALALAVVALADSACDRGDRRPPLVSDSRPTSATITFERDDVSLETDATTALGMLAARAMTSPTARILVVGFANERDALQENLDLAERRARAVARFLASRAVRDHRMVIAAVEAAADDPSGARCEVDVVDALDRAPSARRLLVPSPMPKLEARFHPWQSGDETYVVVGHVEWDATSNDRPRVLPAASLREAHAPSAILATLRHLVGRNAARCERLACLQSRFWSFVPTDDPDADERTESSLA